MYTKVRDDTYLYYDEHRPDLMDHWCILDTEGDVICVVKGEATANALLSHLNR